MMPATHKSIIFTVAVLVSTITLGCAQAGDAEERSVDATSAEAALGVGLPLCPASPTGFARHKDLAYGLDDAQKLDVFVPDGAGPLPLAIFVHGGGWVGGDKASPPIRNCR